MLKKALKVQQNLYASFVYVVAFDRLFVLYLCSEIVALKFSAVQLLHWDKAYPTTRVPMSLDAKDSFGGVK